MIQDGFHNIVHIYPMERNTSNRTGKAQMANSAQPILKDIRCRIIREEKVLFDADIILESGWVIEDQKTLRRYEIVSCKTVNGLTHSHHMTYTLKRRVV